VSHPDHPVARGHLRLASSPSGRGRLEHRFLLFLRAFGAGLAIAWFTVAAWIAVTLALVPLLWRRAPLGRRLRPPERREARVIPFQPRRQALPR
jgi:hypothetical protein